jgi:hypothetical protein
LSNKNKATGNFGSLPLQGTLPETLMAQPLKQRLGVPDR